MLQQPIYYSVVVVVLVILGKLVLLVQCSFDECDLPEVYSPFFDNDNVGSKQPPALHILNSTQTINTDFEFPFQYILMSCSASYPVQWVGNIPQLNYYSYILDDEVRSIVKNNGTTSSVQAEETGTYNNNGHFSEKFTVHLHIGNETFAKPGFSSVNVTCQPVDYYNNNACGKIQVNIKTFKEGLPRNRTMLRVRFTDLVSYAVPQDISSSSMAALILTDKKCSKQENSTQSLQCSSAGVEDKLDDVTNCSSDQIDLISQLHVNPTNLTPPSGVITCKADSQHGDLIYNIPYFFSLPKLCPNEDITLPHVYFKSNITSNMPIASIPVRESDFLSLCVKNASTNREYYVGETLSVTCISSIYYFAQGMRVVLFTTLNNLIKEKDIGVGSKEQAFGSAGYRNITTSFTVGNEKNHEIQCSAPVRKSRNWVTKKIVLTAKLPVRVTFQKTRDTAISDASSGRSYISCNASGDPVPVLTWSRLNDENLPSNETVLEMGKLYNSSLVWISSKLYFPIGSSSSVPSEYYGRYICIAKNKFNALEKTFLFDEKSSEDESGNGSILSGLFRRSWIMAALALLMLLGTFFSLGWKITKQARALRLFTKSEIDEFIFGRPELLLDDSESYEEMNSYAAYLPYDRHQFEIEKEQLEFNPRDIIGTGAYGTVYKGIFKPTCGTVEPVAIKTVSPSSDKTYFAALLSEIKIMCYIGQHGNVVRLVGACTKYLDQRQIFVATELCPNGDLLTYILNRRKTFINNAGLESKRDPKNWVKKPGSNGYCRLAYGRLILSPHLLLVWALQITQGMTYLASRKVVHGDLAARNILLAGDLKPKIADFGLSNKLQKYANYVRKDDDLVPWRWLAVECLQFMKFSSASDIWAFGVVLYELFSLGQVPYGSHCYSELFVVALCQGERLPRPEFASEKIYNLMLDCWKHCPENRPSFEHLQNELRSTCADSEKKMHRPVVSCGLSSPNPREKEEPDKPDAQLFYVNNVIEEMAEENFSAAQRNEEINQNTKNGYVLEVEPAFHQSTPTNNISYVNNPDSLPPAQAPPASSYIDWNVPR